MYLAELNIRNFRKIENIQLRLASKLRGDQAANGQGLVQEFVAATLLRDAHADYFEAFRVAASCVISLLKFVPDGFLSKLTSPVRHAEVITLRRLVWGFVRDSSLGLPPATLVAQKQWHPLMLERVRELLSQIQLKCGYQPVDNLGSRLANRKLPNAPLLDVDLTHARMERIRIDTVHQVKGETLDAVLYIATKAHVRALIDGVESEVGRIGYVAVTRARDLLWLAVPASSVMGFRSALVALGFKEIG